MSLILHFEMRFKICFVFFVVFGSGELICQAQETGEENPVKPIEQRKTELPKGEIEKSIDEYEKFDLGEIEKVVKKFLNSGTVSERLKYVREGVRVRPLMKKYYGGEEIKAEGFSNLSRSEVRYRGALITTFVRTGDFSGSEFSFFLVCYWPSHVVWDIL